MAPSSAAIAYAPRPGIGPEQEQAALANVYRYILDAANKRDRLPDKSGPDDTREKSKYDSDANREFSA